MQYDFLYFPREHKADDESISSCGRILNVGETRRSSRGARTCVYYRKAVFLYEEKSCNSNSISRLVARI